MHSDLRDVVLQIPILVFFEEIPILAEVNLSKKFTKQSKFRRSCVLGKGNPAEL
jgi:hypothetical protein